MVTRHPYTCSCIQILSHCQYDGNSVECTCFCRVQPVFLTLYGFNSCLQHWNTFHLLLMYLPLRNHHTILLTILTSLQHIKWTIMDHIFFSSTFKQHSNFWLRANFANIFVLKATHMVLISSATLVDVVMKQDLRTVGSMYSNNMHHQFKVNYFMERSDSEWKGKSTITGHKSAFSSTHHCLTHLFIFHADMMSMSKKVIQELLGAFPGIDEAMSFAEVMRYCMYVIG